MAKNDNSEAATEAERIAELEAELAAANQRADTAEAALTHKDETIAELEAVAVTSHEGAKHVLLVKGEQKSEVHPSTVKAHIAAGWKHA